MLKISKNGQITLPKNLRDHFHLIEGGLLEAEETPEGILLRPVDVVRRKVKIADIVERTEQALAQGNYTDIAPENLEGFLDAL